MDKNIRTLRRVRHILTRLLDSADLGEATESVDRALDQVNYALEDLGADETEALDVLQEDEV